MVSSWRRKWRNRSWVFGGAYRLSVWNLNAHRLSAIRSGSVALWGAPRAGKYNQIHTCRMNVSLSYLHAQTGRS